MKHFLPVIFFLLSHIAFAQDSKSQLEVMPFIRYDSYPKFSYHYFGGVRTIYLTMKGSSWGTNINYKYSLFKNFRVKAGLGYYRYSFTKINNESFMGKFTGRSIEGIISPYYIVFGTERYWYNCLSLNVGLEKAIPLNRNLQIVTSINFSNYYTYSQVYHINPHGADLRVPSHWRPKDKRHFGYSGSLQLGLTKSIQEYSFGPSLLIPVYDTWRKDEVFGETHNENETRNKLFRGLGLGITINRNL